jgi:hypothetical protein
MAALPQSVGRDYDSSGPTHCSAVGISRKMNLGILSWILVGKLSFFFSFLVGATSGGQTVLTTDRGVRPGRDTMVPLLVANPFTRYGSANTRLASSGCLAIPVFLNA